MSPSRWEEVADEYNRIFEKDTYYWDILGMIADQVKAEEGARILDLGCGTGNLIALLREKFPEVKVSGVDPAQNMLELSSSRFRDDRGVDISLGEGTRIPFLSEHFDYVVSNLALHHVLPELRPLCAEEIGRVLKNGGQLVYCDIFDAVRGEREDPARCRDIVDRMVAYALYNLDIGAFDKMLFLLEQIPRHIAEDGEYTTVIGEWLGNLEESGLVDLEVITPSHPEFGFRIITGRKA
jgi:ubiquinone/menaquinone biosynthesis C-methylase UbiE